MPRLSDILFGIRNLLLVSLCLLLISAVLASLFGLANLSYPASLFTNIALWLAVLVGSYFTTKYLPNVNKGWLIGSVTGGTYGVVVLVVMAVIYNLSGVFSGAALVGLIPLILVYAILGFVGAFVGTIARPQQDYYVER